MIKGRRAITPEGGQGNPEVRVVDKRKNSLAVVRIKCLPRLNCLPHRRTWREGTHPADKLGQSGDVGDPPLGVFLWLFLNATAGEKTSQASLHQHEPELIQRFLFFFSVSKTNRINDAGQGILFLSGSWSIHADAVHAPCRSNRLWPP